MRPSPADKLEEALPKNPPWRVERPTTRSVPEVETAPFPAPVASTTKVPEAKPSVDETPSAKYDGVKMVELLLSMSLRVPEEERSPVYPSAMKRMMLPPSEPIRRVEETPRLPPTVKPEPMELDALDWKPV